jgi:hypothetical protein
MKPLPIKQFEKLMKKNPETAVYYDTIKNLAERSVEDNPVLVKWYFKNIKEYEK